MRSLTTELERTFGGEGVLWGINHGHLRFIVLLRGKEVNLERLDEAINDESANRGVS